MNSQAIVGIVVGAVVLGGCGAGIDTYYSKDRRMIIEHEVSFARPSFTKVTTEVCVPMDGVLTVEVVDGETYRCNGLYVATNVPNFAAQEGAATGLGSAVVLGGAAVGGAYLLGQGISDSGSQTTNNNDTSSNGGNSNSLSSSRSEAFSNSNAAAAATGQGGNGYGYGGSAKGGSVDMGKKYRR